MRCMSILRALSLTRRPSAAFVIVGLFWGTFAAYVPVIKAHLGASDGVFGTLLLGSAVGMVSAMWLAPRLDRLMGSHGMQIAAGLLALVWLIPGVVTVPVLFALMMVVVGGASALLDVTMNARVSELEARHSQSLMNVSHAMFSVGYGTAALVCSVTRDAGLPPVVVFAAMAVVTLAFLPFLRMDVTVILAEDGHSGGYPLWPILMCGGIVLVAFMSEATVEAWSALHVERTLNGGAAEGALGPAMLGLTMALGRFSGQAVSAHLREVTVVVWAALVSASGALIAAIAPTPFVAYVGFGTLGLGVSVIGPMGLALAGKLVAPHYRTEAISRVAVMGFSGFFFAPVAMGLLSEAFGLRVAYACVAGLLLMAIPLALSLGRQPRGISQSRP
jgi:MFS family permease